LKSVEVIARVFAPSVQVEGAAPVRFNAPEEFRVTTPAPEPIYEIPFDDSEVNAPVAGVEAPIAVELIPVPVVFKFDEVIVKVLDPVLMDESESPDRAKAPDVPVRLMAPAD